jgi:hypothetical protein
LKEFRETNNELIKKGHNILKDQVKLNDCEALYFMFHMKPKLIDSNDYSKLDFLNYKIDSKTKKIFIDHHVAIMRKIIDAKIKMGGRKRGRRGPRGPSALRWP